MSNRVGVLAADYVIELASELQQFRGWENSIIVPVASSAARSRERGYNQAARIARAIARTAELPYAEILTRDDRQSQVHVPRAKRKSNIAGAFRAGVAASGRHIILIDDVVESGATLVDARRALLEAGAAGVVAIAIAH
jgi:ComF family protein